MLSFNRCFDNKAFALMSGREEDFALSPSAPENYSRPQAEFVASHAPFSIEEIFSLKQVHGDEIVLLRPGFSSQENYPQADGIITDVPNLPVAIRTADCLPVFIYDERKNCLGLVHAGWKGSAEHISEKALALMNAHFHSAPADMAIVFGPCIRVCCYEVGAEFQEIFPQEVVARGGYFLDLAEVNRRQLIRGGVPEGKIKDCRICTCCDKHYFSYRREGPKAGRMISLMMLKEQETCT